MLLQFFCREERIIQFFCLLSDKHITSSLHLFLLTTLLHSCLSAVYLFFFWLSQFCPEERGSESYSPLSGNHFFFPTLSSQHHTLSVSVRTVSLPPSFLSPFLRSIMVIMQVPMALHAQNRQKLLDRMRAQLEAAGRDSTNGVILLQVLSILPTTTITSTTSLPPCLALPCLSFLSCLLPPWDWCWAQRTNPAVGFQHENQELMTVKIDGFLCVLEFCRFCSFVKTDWCSLTEFFLV